MLVAVMMTGWGCKESLGCWGSWGSRGCKENWGWWGCRGWVYTDCVQPDSMLVRLLVHIGQHILSSRFDWWSVDFWYISRILTLWILSPKHGQITLTPQGLLALLCSLAHSCRFGLSVYKCNLDKHTKVIALGHWTSKNSPTPAHAVVLCLHLSLVMAWAIDFFWSLSFPLNSLALIGHCVLAMANCRTEDGPCQDKGRILIVSFWSNTSKNKLLYFV